MLVPMLSADYCTALSPYLATQVLINIELPRTLRCSHLNITITRVHAFITVLLIPSLT